MAISEEKYPKTEFSRQQVEARGQRRVDTGAAVSFEVMEGDTHWILITELS